ncbi:gibberellin 2-beta-dioxygenase 6-like isoform X1 [Typha angustifolia]|uniref:gibberellin 2-beta-dioxygenase 6-like isoform X1 n=1 Tax=Typha angustifolia TaxID=59011 RepID=UPI003C2D4317
MPSSKSLSEPPLVESYKQLVDKSVEFQQLCEIVDESELPLIELSGLRSENGGKHLGCVEAIGKAASEWGFFQVVNHGVSHELLAEMRREQMKLFEMPFETKARSKLLNDSYRWGTPTATSARQFSWSEAFHVPLAKIAEEGSWNEELSSTSREVMEKLAGELSELAHEVAGALVEYLGFHGEMSSKKCSKSTCFLRLNHYPTCPYAWEAFGLVPHTDSDFLTILHQDQVGGLQLMKDSRWVAVKPNPDALIVNIGDLFQAWSNGIYKSVEHKVIANAQAQRYSIAYFLCPSHESTIGSCREPSMYKKFTFGEFRKQVQEDVRRTGHKVGLPRFLL